MKSHVGLQVGVGGETLLTSLYSALVRLLAGVDQPVLLEMSELLEALLTSLRSAGERSETTVGSQVDLYQSGALQ